MAEPAQAPGDRSDSYSWAGDYDALGRPSWSGGYDDRSYRADRSYQDDGYRDDREWSEAPAPMRPRRPTPVTLPSRGQPLGRHFSGSQYTFRRRHKRSGDDGSGGDEKEPATPLAAAVGAITEVVVVVAMALALALVIKTFLVQAFFIPSESMQNTLLTGDRVLVSKLTPGPFSLHRGDIIVFKDPGGWLQSQPPRNDGPMRKALRDGLTFVGLLPQDSGEHLIKRLIGLPGDTVTCCDSRGRVEVNGVGIDEPYLYPGNVPSAIQFTVTVPKGHLWVMGDHRSVSEDSRYNRSVDDGTVPISDVVGKAFVVVWPLNRFTTLGVPSAVFANVPDPPTAK